MAATATPQLERRLNVPTTSFHNAAVQTQAFGGCSVKAGFGDDAFCAAFDDDLEARLARDEKAEAAAGEAEGEKRAGRSGR